MEISPWDNLARDGRPGGDTARDCLGLEQASAFTDHDAANDSRMSQLARAIEHEIIPRLMLAHRSLPPRLVRPLDAPPTITPGDIEAFARLTLSQDEDRPFAAVDGLRARGVSVESLYLDLLAPTARYLGELWNQDLCTFTDVTVGLGRLQRVLRELSPAFGRGIEHPTNGRRVLLLPSPGEQHTFGLVMVAEFFRRAGWDVSGGAWAANSDAASIAAGEWFDVIGFSLGGECHLQALGDSIAAVRQTSCNRDIAILVGGPLFSEHPGHVAQVGADAMTVDGREAPALAERLIVRIGARLHGGHQR